MTVGNTSLPQWQQEVQWQWRSCRSWKQWDWERQDEQKRRKHFSKLAFNVIYYCLLCFLSSWYCLSRGNILLHWLCYTESLLYNNLLCLLLPFTRFSHYGLSVPDGWAVWTLRQMMLVMLWQYQVHFMLNIFKLCCLITVIGMLLNYCLPMNHSGFAIIIYQLALYPSVQKACGPVNLARITGVSFHPILKLL